MNAPLLRAAAGRGVADFPRARKRRSAL